MSIFLAFFAIFVYSTKESRTKNIKNLTANEVMSISELDCDTVYSYLFINPSNCIAIITCYIFPQRIATFMQWRGFLCPYNPRSSVVGGKNPLVGSSRATVHKYLAQGRPPLGPDTEGELAGVLLVTEP